VDEWRSPQCQLSDSGGYWQLARELRLGFGVENVMDEVYRDHLAGVKHVRGNDAVAPGERLSGYGRNFFLFVDYGR
jgi:outer membrane receptor protein involved in Fe transport